MKSLFRGFRDGSKPGDLATLFLVINVLLIVLGWVFTYFGH